MRVFIKTRLFKILVITLSCAKNCFELVLVVLRTYVLPSWKSQNYGPPLMQELHDLMVFH